MTHPDGCFTGEAFQKAGLVNHMQLGPPILARLGRLHLAAQNLRPDLHSVADAQNRYTHFKNGWIAARRVGLVDAARAAAEDDAFGVEFLKLGGRSVGPNQFAEHALFPHPPRDELGILRAKIQDRDDFVVVHLNLVAE